jgi:outer membrane protein assembly factor BamB
VDLFFSHGGSHRMKYFTLVFGLTFVAILSGPSLVRAQSTGGIVSQEEAQRHGLERAWFAQVNSAVAGTIIELTLDRDILFVQTGRGMLQALDAETGRLLWNVTVGNPGYPSTPVGAAGEHVAMINGTSVYLLDRKTGKELWSRPLNNSAGAAPTVTDKLVFGRLVASPVVTSSILSWTTENGYMYFMSLADPAHLAVDFRLKTENVMASGMGHWTPHVYSASIDGYVYAADEVTGQVAWKFSVGEPLVESPVAVADRVFVCTERGGMHCLNATAGTSEWYAPNVMQFISLSPTHVYATDRLNRLLILDAKTGARLDVMSIEGTGRKLRNGQSDRIFLTTKRGSIQCLHESDLAQPVTYSPPPLPSLEKRAVKQEKLTEKKPAEEGAEDAEEMPAEEPAAEEPAAEDAEPKEEGAAEPEEDNPFG